MPTGFWELRNILAMHSVQDAQVLLFFLSPNRRLGTAIHVNHCILMGFKVSSHEVCSKWWTSFHAAEGTWTPLPAPSYTCDLLPFWNTSHWCYKKTHQYAGIMLGVSEEQPMLCSHTLLFYILLREESFAISLSLKSTKHKHRKQRGFNREMTCQ